jgi:hypothetical protein
MQLPLLAQVSVDGPQVLQDPPAMPHVVRVCASQMPLLQQPPGHEAGVHVHEPLTHAWPCAHSLPLPHEQEPPAQASERSVSQGWHAAPEAPHTVTEVVSHVLPFAQQPALHEAALHTHWPATHCWPVPHGPAVPHLQ